MLPTLQALRRTALLKASPDAVCVASLAGILHPGNTDPQQLPWGLIQQLHTHQQQPQQHQQQQPQRLWQQLSPSHTRPLHSTASCEKSLSDIVKLERLQHETADTVEHIWMAQHASSTSHIATVLSKDEHAIISARAAASPLFVLPLAKQPGAFQTLLLQWQPPNRLLFTTLDEYKQWGPQAAAHLTVQLFQEVAESHQLVLARGDLLNPSLINAAEGRTLLELALAFYRDAHAYKMVYHFNHDPVRFDFRLLCEELGVLRGGGGSGSEASQRAAGQQPEAS